MALYFLETSALVKRYVQEAGTAWVQGLTSPFAGHVLSIAQITAVETVAAITLRARRGNIAVSDANAAIFAFRQHYASDFADVPITSTVIALAMDLAEKHGLRGYDSVQLAAATQIQMGRIGHGLPGLTFVSADQALNAAATAEGLSVDDPNTPIKVICWV